MIHITRLDWLVVASRDFSLWEITFTAENFHIAEPSLHCGCKFSFSAFIMKSRCIGQYFFFSSPVHVPAYLNATLPTVTGRWFDHLCVSCLPICFVEVLQLVYSLECSCGIFNFEYNFSPLQSIVWQFVLIGFITNVINVILHAITIYGIGLGFM